MDDRNITLLYASETGSTEDYAQDLGRTLERLHFNVTMLEMDALEPVCPFTSVIFIKGIEANYLSKCNSANS